MKKFIIKVVVYLALPILVILIAIESILISYPNTFAIKSRYLNDNKRSIEIIFTGSSHTEDGVNPEYINKNTANLGYSAQNLKIDSALISNYIKQLPQLKYVIQETDYIDFFKETKPEYFRYPWYEKYYDIKVGFYPRYKKWSLYLSNPDFFNQFLTNGIWKENNINQFGYNDIELNLRFKQAEYDSIKILKGDHAITNPFELNNVNLNQYYSSVSKITYLKKLCQKNNIEFIQIIYPKHQTYRDQINRSETYKLWREFINQQEKNGTRIWDFEYNPNFYIKDYSNNSHLNNRGAKKLTKMLNDSINLLYSNK